MQVFSIHDTWCTSCINVTDTSDPINFNDPHLAATLEEAISKLRVDLTARERDLKQRLSQIVDCRLALKTGSLDVG